MSYGFTNANIPEKKEFQSLVDQHGRKDILLSESGNRSYLTIHKDIAQEQIARIFALVESTLHIKKDAVRIRKDEEKVVVLLQPLLGLPTNEELQILYNDITKII